MTMNVTGSTQRELIQKRTINHATDSNSKKNKCIGMFMV